jgi:hypothetical protein
VGSDEKAEKLSSISTVINYKKQDFEQEILSLQISKVLM